MLRLELICLVLNHAFLSSCAMDVDTKIKLDSLQMSVDLNALDKEALKEKINVLQFQMKTQMILNAKASCDEYRKYGINTNGRYFIDPDGPKVGVDPFEVECDFKSDGSTETIIIKDKEASDRIMITSGYPQNSKTQETEVIDIFSENVTCQNVAPFPRQISFSFGATLNGSQIICGGCEDAGCVNDCYKFENGTFSHFASMTDQKGFASAVTFNNSMFIFGGSGSSAFLDTVEEILPNGHVKKLSARLPKKLYGLCGVRHNSEIVLSGGTSGTYSSKTIYFSPASNSFSYGPNMQKGRHHHACSKFKSRFHDGNEVMVVAGGYVDGDTENTFVEVLDLETRQQWEQISSLPKAMTSIPTMVPTPNKDGSLIIYQKDIYSLSCHSSGCSWTKKQQQLKTSRIYGPMAFYISHNDTICSEN